MNTVLLTLFFLFVAVIILLSILGMRSRSGEATGLIDGKLARCPNKPNCVCSENTNDTRHYISPVLFPQNTDIDADLIVDLEAVIRSMGGKIHAGKADYLAATFSSAVFGFVDDLEIRIDRVHKMIHFRSASRVGHGDMDVNRKRVELFKKLCNKSLLAAGQSL